MHREIDFSSEQRLSDLFGEGPLAADGLKRWVGEAVAARLDHHELDFQLRTFPFDPRFYPMGLRQGERTAAAAEPEVFHVRQHLFPPLGGTPPLPTSAVIFPLYQKVSSMPHYTKRSRRLLSPRSFSGGRSARAAAC